MLDIYQKIAYINLFEYLLLLLLFFGISCLRHVDMHFESDFINVSNVFQDMGPESDIAFRAPIDNTQVFISAA